VSTPATKPQARIVPRSGLGPVGAKLGEEALSIAYFGASVTAQKEGYRPLLHERLRNRFGQDHSSVFAAVGGVDVVSAAFLADEFVVNHQPDVCLIEFTSSELIWGSTVARAEAAMDGIVAKLRAAGIQVCLLHLARREWQQQHRDLLAAFERGAERHGVPSIDLTAPFAESAATDPLFRDLVHMTPAGAELVAELASKAIGSIAASGPADQTDEQAAGRGDEDFRGAHVVPVAAEDATGAEMRLFRLHRPYLELPPGPAIRRQFTNRVAGLVMVVGPEAGELEITDRRGSQRLMTWDEYCHYDRFTSCLFERPCEPGSDVSIELTDAVPDYARCRRPLDAPERRVAKVMGYMVLPA
jgi:GDSL-like Lipase/Acylhydrolase family